MKKPSLPERLAVALLSEIASGHYSNKTSFLSRREIMRLWKVSSPTATKSLEILERWNIISARSRSGQRFRSRYLQRALVQLNKTRLVPLPGQPSWEAKVRQLRAPGAKLERIAVVSICEVNRHAPGRYAGVPESLFSIPIHIPSQAIFNKANKVGVSVDFYLDDGDPENGREIVEGIVKSGIQGVILLRRLLGSPVAPLAEPLLAAGIPVVTVFDDCEHLRMVSVNFNNVGLGYKSAQVFLKKGHRRIVVVLPEGGEEPGYYQGRYHGAELAVNEFNAAHPDTPAELMALEIPLGPEATLSDAAELFAKDHPHRPTALLSTSVNLLRTLYPVLQKAMLSIPEDLSIMMCSTTAQLPPKGEPIDIMKLDFEEIGAQAFAALQLVFANQFAEKAWLIDSRYEAHGTVASPPRPREL